MCGGVQLHIIDRKLFPAVKVGWTMLDVIRKMYPEDFKVNKPYVEGRPGMLEFNTGCGYIKEGTKTLEEQLEIIENDTKTNQTDAGADYSTQQCFFRNKRPILCRQRGDAHRRKPKEFVQNRFNRILSID